MRMDGKKPKVHIGMVNITAFNMNGMKKAIRPPKKNGETVI